MRNYTNPELKEIAQDISSGKYSRLEQQLFAFLKKNIAAVEREKNVWDNRLNSAVTPTFAAKQVILRCKSIDARTEIGLQCEEIRKEAWYRREPDHDAVAVDWARKHAGGWRDHYALTLALILDARENEFLAMYGAQTSNKSETQ